MTFFIFGVVTRGCSGSHLRCPRQKTRTCDWAEPCHWSTHARC